MCDIFRKKICLLLLGYSLQTSPQIRLWSEIVKIIWIHVSTLAHIAHIIRVDIHVHSIYNITYNFVPRTRNIRLKLITTTEIRNIYSHVLKNRIEATMSVPIYQCARQTTLFDGTLMQVVLYWQFSSHHKSLFTDYSYLWSQKFNIYIMYLCTFQIFVILSRVRS